MKSRLKSNNKIPNWIKLDSSDWFYNGFINWIKVKKSIKKINSIRYLLKKNNLNKIEIRINRIPRGDNILIRFISRFGKFGKFTLLVIRYFLKNRDNNFEVIFSGEPGWLAKDCESYVLNKILDGKKNIMFFTFNEAYSNLNSQIYCFSAEEKFLVRTPRLNLSDCISLDKTRGISFLNSGKRKTSGHMLRNLLFQKLAQDSRVDLFGNDSYSHLDEKTHYQNRILTLRNYRFTIIVENDNSSYLSEQVFDAMLMETIPIYIGGGLDHIFKINTNFSNLISKNIFNKALINISHENSNELIKNLDHYDEEYYRQAYDDVKRNKEFIVKLYLDRGWDGRKLVDSNFFTFVDRIMINIESYLREKSTK